MDLGVFAKVFTRPTVEETLDAVASHGLTHVQFNLSCVGLPTLPDSVDEGLCKRVSEAMQARGLTMAAISGTFNLIDPDRDGLKASLARLDVLAAACDALGTSLITLCTGTRDPHDMWRFHPESAGREAWTDLEKSITMAVAIAETRGVTLGVEPELSNVVDSAAKARRLLDAIGSPRLKIVIDPANIFPPGTLPRMREILDEAFDLLGHDIVLAHAKDLSQDGKAGHEAAGTGALDYDHYLRRLEQLGYEGPLILHGLTESEVAGSVAFLRGKLKRQQ
jgi:sugar phosphate isomerase/epimerase